MAIKYWGTEVSEPDCDTILNGLSVPAFEGPNARQIVKSVEQVIGMSTEVEPRSLDATLDDFVSSEGVTVPAAQSRGSFRQELFHARDLGSLRAAFKVSRQIPQIVIYDDDMASYHEQSPGGHAALVHTLDFGTRFIYLVDPNQQARRGSPIYYTFDDFERGWRPFVQSTVIIYPSQLYTTVRSIVSVPNLGGSI